VKVPDGKNKIDLIQSLNGGAVLSQKTAQHYARQASERQPKVFVKTFGWQMDT